MTENKEKSRIEIDEDTFADIIVEEVERITFKRGLTKPIEGEEAVESESEVK